ncbi:FHA domain-containing protein [Pelatocladus sp. BLCC-F211]|uniref:FHA domain-containing protein n=1 Tax=Pelatocladus sp. BLCC-F211 TaxID=3342752 RepID=UPI0035BAF50B
MKIKVCNSETLAELKEFDLISAMKITGECIIGRSAESGLVLDSLDVSRHHGKLFTKDGNYYFCDLGSRNGSMVNDELVEKNQEYLLNSGDSIRIGDFLLKIEQEEELPETVFKVIDPWLLKTKPIDVKEILKAEEMVPPSAAISEVVEGIIPKSGEMILPPEVVSEVVEEEEEEIPTPEEIVQSPEAITEDVSTIKTPELLTQKHIVLIAHDTKTSELVEFVSQHQDLFSQCRTISWSSISERIHQQTGITISQEIPSEISGGYQTIASLVNSGDILAVIFLRDFLQPHSGQANEEALLRLCNINQVLLATNMATAAAIANYIFYSPK